MSKCLILASISNPLYRHFDNTPYAKDIITLMENGSAKQVTTRKLMNTCMAEETSVEKHCAEMVI